MAIEKATRKSTEKTKKGKPVGKAVLLDSTDSRMQVEGEDYGDYTPINGKYYGVSKNYTKEKEATVKLLDATSAPAKSATTQVVTSPVTQTASSDSQSRSLANSAASPRPVAGIPSRKSTLLDSELMPSKNLLDAKIFPILSSELAKMGIETKNNTKNKNAVVTNSTVPNSNNTTPSNSAKVVLMDSQVQAGNIAATEQPPAAVANQAPAKKSHFSSIRTANSKR